MNEEGEHMPKCNLDIKKNCIVFKLRLGQLSRLGIIINKEHSIYLSSGSHGACMQQAI